MDNVIYTKVYGHGRLKFEVKVSYLNDQHYINLYKLPRLPEEFKREHYLDDQFVSVVYKELLTPDQLGWDKEDGHTREDLIERLNENAGFESEKFIVSEYTGSENSSDNLTPDVAMDGFDNYGIEAALSTLDNDQALLNVLDGLMANKILVG